jgi:hypothetical protein
MSIYIRPLSIILHSLSVVSCLITFTYTSSKHSRIVIFLFLSLSSLYLVLCLFSFFYIYAFKYSFILSTLASLFHLDCPHPYTINISALSLQFLLLIRLTLYYIRPKLNIALRADTHSFVYRHKSSMQTDKNLDTFLSVDTSRALILVLFHLMQTMFTFSFLSNEADQS